MSNDSKKTTENEPKTSARRELLGSGAVAAAGMMFGLLAVACSDDDSDPKPTQEKDTGPGSPDAGTPDAAVATADADLVPLNALLTAEYNAITAYTAGAGLITAAKTTDPLYALRSVIVDIAVDIQAHHKLHAAALVEAIEKLKGTPVVESEVAAKFTPPKGLTDNPTISNVLKFAAGAERGATVAYNQVLAGLEDAKLRFLASAIEGDESQHFIVLAALVLGLAAPGPNLDASRADDVVPEAFVTTVNGKSGLDVSPANYFA